MYGTTVTNFMVESATPNLFVFTVVAINILGEGEESDITSEFCGAYIITTSKFDTTELCYLHACGSK